MCIRVALFSLAVYSHVAAGEISRWAFEKNPTGPSQGWSDRSQIEPMPAPSRSRRCLAHVEIHYDEPQWQAIEFWPECPTGDRFFSLSFQGDQGPEEPFFYWQYPTGPHEWEEGLIDPAVVDRSTLPDGRVRIELLTSDIAVIGQPDPFETQGRHEVWAQTWGGSISATYVQVGVPEANSHVTLTIGAAILCLYRNRHICA